MIGVIYHIFNLSIWLFCVIEYLLGLYLGGQPPQGLSMFLVFVLLTISIIDYAFGSSARKRHLVLSIFSDIFLVLPLLQLFGSTILSPSSFIIIRGIVLLITDNQSFEKLMLLLYKRPNLYASLGFLFLILFGTFLLYLPVSVKAGNTFSIVDALFTATSAVCVTGLIVKDTGHFFSPIGQIIILGLIQVGALSIMLFASMLFVGKKGRGSLVQVSAVKEVFDQETLEELRGLVRFIVLMTFSLELIGAIALSIYWHVYGKMGLVKAVYAGVFHSVSAFCNAGFSLFRESLLKWESDPFVVLVISILIVLGGLGFFVVSDIVKFISGAKKRLAAQSVIVLSVSLTLIIMGAALIYFFEQSNAFASLGIKDRVLNAVFNSITARTAGFNTLSVESFSLPTTFLLLVLMFIGASSGSTGGGIKTNTVGVLLLNSIAFVKGKDLVFRGRSLHKDTINKAIAIVIFGAMTLFAGILLLLFFEKDKPFLDVVFEAVSAFGTVGLSRGITADLSTPSKLVITVLMYIGRLGPVTLALSLAKQPKDVNIYYPPQKIMVG